MSRKKANFDSSSDSPLPSAPCVSGRDVISNLPDDVRVYILSFLPTKDAFKTSILSSKWENLWTTVPILKFEHNNWFCNGEEPGYVEFIEMVVMSHTSSINSFHMYCTSQCISRLKVWLSVLVKSDVQEIVISGYDVNLELPKSLFTCKTLVTLDLCPVLRLDDVHVPAYIHFPCLKVLNLRLRRPHSALIQKILCSSPLLEDISIYAKDEKSQGGCLQLPISLFTSKSLVTLRLHFVVLLDVPASVHFPCLKVLEVSLNYPSSVLTRKLFCSSPVLEDLSIFATYEDFGGKYIYSIASPYLKKLSVGSRHDNFNCVVNVVAPKLEFLELQHAYSVHFITHSPALKEARLDYCQEDDDLLVAKLAILLKIVSSVKILYLRDDLSGMVFGGAFDIKWPDFANVTHLSLTLDDFDFSSCLIFPKLKHLKLYVKDDFASKNLSDMLELAPDLVSLKFVKGPFGECPNKFNSLEQRVPRCVRSCLKEVVVKEIDELESVLFLIKYLLTNAQVLQKISFKFSYEIREDPAKLDELIKKLGEKVDELESEIENSSKNLERVFYK